MRGCVGWECGPLAHFVQGGSCFSAHPCRRRYNREHLRNTWRPLGRHRWSRAEPGHSVAVRGTVMDSTGWAIATDLLAQGVKLRFLWATLALVGTLLAGAAVLAIVERWRKRST